mgnify:CR=1 FL=1
MAAAAVDRSRRRSIEAEAAAEAAAPQLGHDEDHGPGRAGSDGALAAMALLEAGSAGRDDFDDDMGRAGSDGAPRLDPDGLRWRSRIPMAAMAHPAMGAA